MLAATPNSATDFDRENAISEYVCQGYTTALQLSPEELATILALVREQWLAVLTNSYPQLRSTFNAVGLSHYHLKSDLIAHSALWGKHNRILTKSMADTVCNLPFMSQLTALFGEFEISQEEKSGYGEIYWRLVRPNSPTDIGPIHADEWFWRLGHGQMQDNQWRIKVWIPLIVEPGLSGLLVVKQSHTKTWKYHGEQRDGIMKPVLDEIEEDLGATLLPLRPGNALIFHDQLLHGGAINRGTLSRVSIEFTMLVDREYHAVLTKLS